MISCIIIIKFRIYKLSSSVVIEHVHRSIFPIKKIGQFYLIKIANTSIRLILKIFVFLEKIMSSISSKTVIVIDKSYYMCRRVQHALNIDSIVRGNADESYVQKSPTIYQSALQSLTEYCRIVWDIFGSERRFLLKTFYKNRTKTISSWNNQGMDYLRDTLRRSAQNSPNAKDIDASQQSPKYSHLKNVIEDSLKDLAAKSQKNDEESGEKRTAGETGRILVFTYATEENLEVQSNQWRKDLTSSIEKINANARTVLPCIAF